MILGGTISHSVQRLASSHFHLYWQCILNAEPPVRMAKCAVGTAADSQFCILFRQRTYCNVLISSIHSHRPPRKICCSGVRLSRCLCFFLYLWTQSRAGFRLEASQGRGNSLLSSKFQTFSSSCSARMLSAVCCRGYRWQQHFAVGFTIFGEGTYNSFES